MIRRKRLGSERPWKPSRRDRRVLLALLSGAGNLSGYPISRTAQVRAGTLYPLLARLEKRGWVTSEWEVRTDGRLPRRFYSLTSEGRRCALALLGLEEKR